MQTRRSPGPTDPASITGSQRALLISVALFKSTNLLLLSRRRAPAQLPVAGAARRLRSVWVRLPSNHPQMHPQCPKRTGLHPPANLPLYQTPTMR